MKEENVLKFKGGSKMSLVPFGIFIIITISLSFINAADLNMMIASGIIGLICGMIFSEEKDKYWNTVLNGLGEKLGMTAVLIWLIVGIYGAILKSGHIVEGLVWLSVQLHLKGAAFTVAAFIFSATFAVATGAAFGTIAAMGFILYPVGILLGSSPAVLGGAIISGALFGDNIAPVSDTTIVSSTGQTYKNKSGSADIGGAVKDRSKYVIIAAIISIILFFIFGGAKVGEGLDPILAEQLLAEHQMPKGLLLLIPTAIVIYMAVKGKNLFITLSLGIIIAIIVGLGANLFTLSDLCSIQNGSIKGAFPDGVAGMTTVCILLMVIVSMGNLLTSSGFMDEMVDYLNNSVIKSVTGAELVMFIFASIFSLLISAINTIPNICAGPLLDAIGKKNDIHPYRRANILAVSVCSFNAFMPFGGSVLLLLGIMNTLSSTYTFIEVLSPNAFLFTTFYPLVIWIVMFVAILTGWGRIYEGTSGEPVKKLEK
ncbi:MAG: hypothetical protein KHZ27_07170 [Fusobacterium sp.]|nr:hypothetical protein [Fusobacterium sp.]